ncbi:MAG TPA: hypothetical protein DDY82_01035 [Clostridiales bacterium]|nr:hypothetical protein [Clostridiales bacterium]
MKISNKSLQKYVYGVYQTKIEKGYLGFYHYDDKQMDYLLNRDASFWYPRSKFSSSVTLEFKTQSTFISFDYKIVEVGSYDSVDVYVNSFPYQIVKADELEKKGTLSFSLPEGEKKVTVYFPIDLNIQIKNFVTEQPLKKVKKSHKVLWLGDSITQGYGTFLTGETYVNVANRVLNYDILNQGIGGYIFDSKILTKMDGYTPEKIIVSFGTNHYKADDFLGQVSAYFKQLSAIYKDIKTLVITPIFRCDDGSDLEKLKWAGKEIERICSQYSNVTVVNGFTLVPHLAQYYFDGLHPNALGANYYGRNLVEFIKKVKF